MIGSKCVRCKKQKYLHAPMTQACPVGKRRKVMGSPFYDEHHPTNTFQPKEKSTGGASEKRKDRKTRRAVKVQPCAACWTLGTDWNPVDPAHIRTFKVTQSDHPANMIPLCRECHRAQHADGWALFLLHNQHVAERLEKMGWQLTQHPFEPMKLIMIHPEVA